MSAFKCGDLAYIEWRHSEARGSGPAVRRSDGWDALDERVGHVMSGDTLTARPLVVIDPEDREQVERLAAACRSAFGWTSGPSENDITQTQVALRSLLAPERPAEPLGLGAVVEAMNDNQFVRVASVDEGWLRADALQPADLCTWRDIDVVRVLSPGVTEDGAS